MRKERIVTGAEKRAILKKLEAQGELPSFEKLRKLWILRGRRERPGHKTWAQEAGFFIAARQFKLLPKRMGFIQPAKRIQLPDFPEVSPAAVHSAKPGPVPTEIEPPKSAPPPAPSPEDEPPAKTQVSLLERVEWVYEHLGNDSLVAADAPTPGTWTMFEVYNKGGESKQDFYKTFATKLLPTKATLDIETQRYDKGEVALSFLAQCQAASQRAKRIVSESVPSKN